MKKFIFLLLSLLASSLLFSQTAEFVKNGGVFTAPNYVYVGGETADTLAKNDTLDIVVRIKGGQVQKVLGWLYVDKVSGTISDTVYIYGSGASTLTTGKFAGIDTIRNSNISDGWITFTQSRFTDFSYPWLIVRSIAKGGAAKKSIRKVELMLREN